MIIDAHQHFWTLQRTDYDWLTPDLGLLYQDFSPEDLEPLLVESGIDKTILVQAAATVDETRYLLKLAEQSDFVAGVVGWIDLEDGPAAASTLKDLAASSKFVGVRPMIQDIADPAWMMRPDLAPGIEALIDQDVCFDALVMPVHLPYLIKFIQRYPQLRIVIDHGAKPDIAGEQWQPWADLMSEIATRPGVYCKYSGLVTQADPEKAGSDVVPYANHLLQSFGCDRLIWGSDWPVLKLAGDYAGWLALSSQLLEPLDETARWHIYGGNAETFYGLGEK